MLMSLQQHRGYGVRSIFDQGRCVQLRDSAVGDDDRTKPLLSRRRPKPAALGPRHGNQVQKSAGRAGPHPHGRRFPAAPAEDGDGAGPGASLLTRLATRAAHHGRCLEDVDTHKDEIERRGERQSRSQKSSLESVDGANGFGRWGDCGKSAQRSDSDSDSNSVVA